MSLGWCMGRRWPCSPVGIRTPDCFWTVQGSHLDWVLGSDYLAASAGVGITGDMSGATKAGGSSTTTTRTSRIAGLSSIAIIFTRVERISMMLTPVVEVLTEGIKAFVGPITRTHRQERTPAPSVGLIMEGLREAILPADRPALAVSTAAEDCTQAEAFTPDAGGFLPAVGAPRLAAPHISPP